MASQEKINLVLSDYNLLEKYLEDLFRFMPLPTALLSPLQVVLEFNPAFEQISGYSAEEIVGLPIKKLFDSEEIKKILKESLRKRGIEEKEIYLIRKDKKLVPVTLFVKTRIVKGGKGGYFVSLFDLSEIKKKQERLEEIKNTLEIRVKAREKELKELSKELERKVKERKREIREKIKALDKIRRRVVRNELLMIKIKKENTFLRRRIEELGEIIYGR